MANLIGTYGSNSSSSTTMKVEWESISATLIRLYLTYHLGSATGLGTGNSRDVQVSIFDSNGTQIASGSAEVKSTSVSWSANGTYTAQIDVTIPYRSGGSLLVTAKTVVGAHTTGVTSCLWTTTPGTNYPNQASVGWPVYNTAPYWAAGAGVTLDKSGIIPESTAAIGASWPAATDDQANTIYYDVWRVSSLGNVKIASGITGTSCTDSIGAGNEGATYRYDIYCHDGSLWAPTNLSSATVIKNALTGASIAVTGSFAYLASGAQQLSLSRVAGSNTDGSVISSYALSIAGLTIYRANIANGSVTDLSSPHNFGLRRDGAYPATPYIDWAALKTYLGASFVGSVPLTITTANAYGTVKTYTVDIPADLRVAPSWVTPGIAYSGGYTIGTTKYLPDVRDITLAWNAATDGLGGSITYDVEYKLAADSAWTRAKSDVTGLTTTIKPPSGDAQLTYSIRVIAKTSYGTQIVASGANLLIDKYLRPTLRLLAKNRQLTSVAIGLSIDQRTSLAGATIDTLTYTKVGGAAVALTPTTDWTPSFTYTEPGVFLQTSSYTMRITFQDSVGPVIGAAALTLDIPIASYIPVFSIRKKGVGINCINDGTGSYKGVIAGKMNSVADAGGCKGYYVDGVDILLKAYPIGSIYLSVLSTSPATLFGGTWSAWGNARVPVGYDATDTDFNASEKTGGAKTVTLDTTQIPSHRHNEIFTNVPLTSGSTNIALVVDSGGVSDNNPNQMGYTGGGLAHNNQMQYITCYMWKRTA